MAAWGAISPTSRARLRVCSGCGSNHLPSFHLQDGRRSLPRVRPPTARELRGYDSACLPACLPAKAIACKPAAIHARKHGLLSTAVQTNMQVLLPFAHLSAGGCAARWASGAAERAPPSLVTYRDRTGWRKVFAWHLHCLHRHFLCRPAVEHSKHMTGAHCPG